MEESKQSDTCNELKNIQYQSMLLNTSNPTQYSNQTSENMEDLEAFFIKEKAVNQSLPWLKLDKTAKQKKLLQFARKYTNEHNLTKEDTMELGYYLKDCLERRKLQKQKDILYDKQNGTIKQIPNLQFNKTTRKFNLKQNEKKKSITKGLAPKTAKKTMKSKSRDNK